VTRRNTAPGQHGANFSKLTEYGKQLREKQKAKRIFGVLEKQFHKYYELATKKTGSSADLLLQYLERRVDNVVYKSGLAQSRMQARQMIGHGLFSLNGRRITIPSALVREGAKLTINEKGKKTAYFADKKVTTDRAPRWLEVDGKQGSVTVKALPEGDDLEKSINSRLIIEFYSR
jgi:small subunit ribosomal protein S4